MRKPNKTFVAFVLAMLSFATTWAQNVAKVGDTEYATIEEAVEAWTSGTTLTLLADVNLSSTIVVTEKVTLNLSTYTLTAPSENNHAIAVRGTGNANLTVNADATNPGKIKSNATSASQFFGCTSACIYADYNDCGYKKTITINGGVFEGALLFNQKTSGEKGTPLAVTINGGYFKNAINAYRCYYLTINGGTFDSFNGSGAYQTSTCKSFYYGGRYKSTLTTTSGSSRAYYYGSVDIRSATNTDYYYIDEEGYYVLTKGSSYLPSTYEALANNYRCKNANSAIEKFNTVILQSDVVATQNKTVSSGTLTIDASAEGADYTGAVTLSGTSGNFVIKFPEARGFYGNVTASRSGYHLALTETTENGIVTRQYSVKKDGTTQGDCEAKIGDVYYDKVYDAFYDIDGNTENKTITLLKDVTDAHIITNGKAVNAAGKTVVTFDLNGHSFRLTGAGTGNQADYTLTVVDSSEGKTGVVTNTTFSLLKIALTDINDYSGQYTLHIEGGTWYFDPEAVVYDAQTYDLVGDGFTVTNNGNGTWTVGEVVLEPVAQIGEETYTTLADAFAAANENGNVTIELLADYDLETNEPGYGWTTTAAYARDNMLTLSGNNVTLNLNGHKLYNLFNNAICITGDNVTVKNGGLEVGRLYPNDKYCSYALRANGAEGLVIDNVSTLGGLNISASTATINNLSFIGTVFYALCSQDGAKVTLNGGTFTKNEAGSANALFWVENGSELNITAGTYYIDQTNVNSKFYLTSGVKPVVTGGIFDFDPTACVAEGYAAVETQAGTEWKVGAVETGNLTAEEEVTEETEEVNYTVPVTVVNEEYGLEETMTAATVTVSIDTEKDEAETKLVQITGLNEVVAAAVSNAGAEASDVTAVKIAVVSEAQETQAENTIVYEVHPEAVAFVNEVEVSSVEITNEQISGSFTFALPVSNALAADGKVKVVHKSADYPEETFILNVEGTADNYFVTVTTTHFSSFELSTVGDPVNAVGSVVTVNEFATFCSTQDIRFDGDVKAYVATSYVDAETDNIVYLTQITNVPAGTGVLLKGNGNVTLKAATTTDAVGTNYFKAVLETATVPATDGSFTNFYLTNQTSAGASETAFYLIANTGKEIPAGKAYMQLPSSLNIPEYGTGDARINFIFSDEVTGIKTFDKTTIDTKAVYDMQGRRVENPTRGLYIINGKKVVVR